MSLNYGEILKKSFNYTKNNRSLWFFGFILVLFGGGGGFAFPNFNINLGSDLFQKKGNTGIKSLPKIFPKIDPSTLLTIIIVGVVAIICIWLLVLFIQHLSRGALIEMVDDVDNGKSISIKGGFRGGFQYAMPLIGILIVISIPAIIASLVFGAILIGPGIGLIVAKKTILGIIATILGGLVWILLIIVLAVAIGIVNMLASRFYVIDGVGIMNSIKKSYLLFRNNIGPTLLLWLINVGIGIGQAVVMLVIILLLFLILGILLGLPIVLLAMNTNIWLYALLIIPIGLFMLIVSFIGGLFQSFFSVYWTLAFKDLTSA